MARIVVPPRPCDVKSIRTPLDVCRWTVLSVSVIPVEDAGGRARPFLPKRDRQHCQPGRRALASYRGGTRRWTWPSSGYEKDDTAKACIHRHLRSSWRLLSPPSLPHTRLFPRHHPAIVAPRRPCNAKSIRPPSLSHLLDPLSAIPSVHGQEREGGASRSGTRSRYPRVRVGVGRVPRLAAIEESDVQLRDDIRARLGRRRRAALYDEHLRSQGCVDALAHRTHVMARRLSFKSSKTG
ncbi:hypothetical protein C8R45DRAFT_381951 [Mycena sanguinolenta]|nr:hypothetical protein C8R45DRAFT_381951 [Mycena sanguinolenta]